ncbi:WS/DGAT domain-containing protein [Marinobacter fonticola]|uniref:WS/DGAT domain-containing protein n=1 Tax=Marinobacter fonticola TaxID=2603215 RepID=UPI0011E80227|nr:WS/DGAT domain-containing protein [Marinobacter fonticola]
MSHAETSLLSPVDAAWLSMESPANPMTITVMLRVDGLTAPVFKRFLENHWLRVERFRCRPVRNGAAWWWEEDELFRLRHHLKVVPDAFDEPALQTWLSARLNQPLPDYRPRWCFWLLPQARGGAALVLRLHHCYADGLSLIDLFNALTTTAPDAMPAATLGSEKASDASRWRDAGWQWLQSQVKLADTGTLDDVEAAEKDQPGSTLDGRRQQLERAAWTGLRLVNELSQYVLEPADTPTRLKPGLLGRRTCRWSAPVPLAAFRTIARDTNCKINDVLLACVAQALRKQLEQDNLDLEEVMLHAAVPVDIRGLLPDSVRPEPGELGNLFGTVFVPLPVDAQSPLESLYRVKQETRRLKRSWQPGISWGLMCSAGLLPRLWQQPVADLFCRKATAVVSNVRGSPETRYLAGCRVREQMFWVPQSGDIGLGLSIVSYAGQVQFGVVADEAVLPDPQPFLDDCLDALRGWQ